MKRILIVLFIVIVLSYNTVVFATEEDDVLPPVDPSNYDVYEGEINPAGDAESKGVSAGKIVIYVGVGVLLISGGVFLYKKYKENNS